jgi:hypothetical protein
VIVFRPRRTSIMKTHNVGFYMSALNWTIQWILHSSYSTNSIHVKYCNLLRVELHERVVNGASYRVCLPNSRYNATRPRMLSLRATFLVYTVIYCFDEISDGLMGRGKSGRGNRNCPLWLRIIWRCLLDKGKLIDKCRSLLPTAPSRIMPF